MEAVLGLAVLSALGGLIRGLFGLALFALHVMCVLWAFGDAESRGKPGVLVALLVAFFPAAGLIIWLIFRPEDRIVRH